MILCNSSEESSSWPIYINFYTASTWRTGVCRCEPGTLQLTLTYHSSNSTHMHMLNLQHQSLILRDSSSYMFRQTRIHASFSHSLFLENVVKLLPWMWGRMGFQSHNCYLEATRHMAQRQEHGIVGKIGNLALCLSCTALIFSHQELQQRIWGLRLTDPSSSATDAKLYTEHTGNRYYPALRSP